MYTLLHILRFSTFFLAILLYVVGWKRQVINTNLIISGFSIKNSQFYKKRKKSFFSKITHSNEYFKLRLYHNLCYDLICFIIFRICPRSFHPAVQYDTKQIQELKHNLSKHNTIIYSIHFSNFEWMASYLVQLKIPLQAATHPPHNSAAKFILNFLRKSNTYTADFKNQFNEIRKLFQKKNVLGWMIDQRPKKPSSINEKFLNIKTNWDPTPKYLEQKFKTKQFSCYLLRTSWTQFELHILETPQPYPHHFQHFETLISKYPEQYYGFTHKRFSHSHHNIYKKP